jgi:hypothetical protein
MRHPTTVPGMTETLVTHTNEQVTPAQALKYLKQNKLNRPIREWRVKLLAHDMTHGDFKENGEAGITFDWNDNIAGGQHTLNAIIRSGKTITLRVTRGVDPAARFTMNDSMHQQFSDDLGVAGVPSAAAAEALVRKVIVWENVAKEHKGQGGLNYWRGNRISRSQLAAEWPTYAEGINATVQDTKDWRQRWGGIGNRGALQMFWWILTEKHGFPQNSVNEFLSRIVYGSQDEQDRIIFNRLRAKLAADPDTPRQVWWMIRVWNAWTGEEHLKKLQEPKGGFTDPYPKIRRPR